MYHKIFALTDYTEKQYNKNKENNAKGVTNEQNYKDSGILERGTLSAVGGNGNNVRNKSYGAGKFNAGLEISSKKWEINAERLLHTGISSGYLEQRTISTRYNYKRLTESILRGWEGKLADTDANGRKHKKRRGRHAREYQNWRYQTIRSLVYNKISRFI
jgi:hypothetical protein